MNSFQSIASFPFANVDLDKAWSLRLPFVSIDKLLEVHRKNTDALASANQVAFDGLRSLLERQGDLLKTTVDEYTRVASDVLASRTIEEGATKQADAARSGYDLTLARLRELGDIATKASVAAVDILTARVTESFDELKTLFAAPVDPAAAAIAAPPPVIDEPVAEEPVAAAEETEDTTRTEQLDTSVEPEPVDSVTPRTVRAAPGGRTGRRPRR